MFYWESCRLLCVGKVGDDWDNFCYVGLTAQLLLLPTSRPSNHPDVMDNNTNGRHSNLLTDISASRADLNFLRAMTVNINQYPDIPYFRSFGHLISKNTSSIPLLLDYPSVKMDAAYKTEIQKDPSAGHKPETLEIEIKQSLSFCTWLSRVSLFEISMNTR